MFIYSLILSLFMMFVLPIRGTLTYHPVSWIKLHFLPKGDFHNKTQSSYLPQIIIYLFLPSGTLFSPSLLFSLVCFWETTFPRTRSVPWPSSGHTVSSFSPPLVSLYSDDSMCPQSLCCGLKFDRVLMNLFSDVKSWRTSTQTGVPIQNRLLHILLHVQR